MWCGKKAQTHIAHQTKLMGYEQPKSVQSFIYWCVMAHSKQENVTWFGGQCHSSISFWVGSKLHTNAGIHSSNYLKPTQHPWIFHKKMRHPWKLKCCVWLLTLKDLRGQRSQPATSSALCLMGSSESDRLLFRNWFPAYQKKKLWKT